MLEACAAADTLSGTIPLVAPAACAGKVAVFETAAGGQAGSPATLMDMRQPVAVPEHGPTNGVPAPVFELLPTLKKIQSSVEVGVPLTNSVIGEHALLFAITKPVRGVPTLVSTAVAGAKLS